MKIFISDLLFRSLLQGVNMSCTVCPPDFKCPHNKRSTIHSAFQKGKMKKPPEDDNDLTPGECTSGDVTGMNPGDLSPGFLKYLKRCFRLHFRGNSTKKHKAKTVQDSETVPTVTEVKTVNPPVDAIIFPPVPVILSPDPVISTAVLPPKPVTSNSPTLLPKPVISSSPALPKPVTSPNPGISPSSPSLSPTSSTNSNPNHSGTTHTVNNTQKSLAVELLNLSKYGWYWGPITQAEAVEKLLDQPDGSFLVRDSYADHFLVSMSFKTLGKIYHTRINHSNGHFFFYTSPQHSCASIPELIEVSMDSSKSSIFCYSRPSSPFSPSLPIRLTRPLSRFTEVRSLQHLCRFVIRQYTRIDQIKELPLPNRLCGYLEAKQF